MIYLSLYIYIYPREPDYYMNDDNNNDSDKYTNDNTNHNNDTTNNTATRTHLLRVLGFRV